MVQLGDGLSYLSNLSFYVGKCAGHDSLVETCCSKVDDTQNGNRMWNMGRRVLELEKYRGASTIGMPKGLVYSAQSLLIS